MINIYLIDKYISLCGFDNLGKGQNKYNFRCILCGDSKKSKRVKHAYILINDKGCIYYCHKCHASISFDYFLKQYKPLLYEEYKKEKFIDQLGFKVEKKEENIFKNSQQSILKFLANKSILEQLKKVREASEALEWCNKRKFLDWFIDELYYTDNYISFLVANKIKTKDEYKYIPEYDKRIVIPVYDKNKELAYLQGRSIENIQLRYITTIIKAIANVPMTNRGYCIALFIACVVSLWSSSICASCASRTSNWSSRNPARVG